MNKSRNGAVFIAGAASLLLISACGSDDDSSADDTESCDAWIAADGAVTSYLFAGEGDADSTLAALDAAIAAAPDDISQTMTDLKTAAQPQIENPESDASDETLRLYGDTLAWVAENCDVETIDVTATEYEFDGIPDALSTGYHVIDFANGGQEQHEAVAFMINDGVAQSFEEIFQLPEEEIFSKITPVGASFAMPGDSDTGSWNLESPGTYAVVCFVSTGSVGETEGDGPPHMAQGMIHEFTVT